MAQVLPKWTNKLPTYAAGGIGLFAVVVIGFFWYYGSPWYTDVGYQPRQPVPFSHKLHAGDLGMDCRYCHHSVEMSPHANVPPTQTCMNCHKLILPESERLLPVRESWDKSQPLQWVRVHRLPDFAYFSHAAHLTAGVGCFDCHGNVRQMEIVSQVQPLSMGWCLDCHRDPAPRIRPREELTNMEWEPPADQAEFARRVMQEKNTNPPVECSGCHR